MLYINIVIHVAVNKYYALSLGLNYLKAETDLFSLFLWSVQKDDVHSGCFPKIKLLKHYFQKLQITLVDKPMRTWDQQPNRLTSSSMFHDFWVDIFCHSKFWKKLIFLDIIFVKYYSSYGLIVGEIGFFNFG